MAHHRAKPTEVVPSRTVTYLSVLPVQAPYDDVDDSEDRGRLVVTRISTDLLDRVPELHAIWPTQDLSPQVPVVPLDVGSSLTSEECIADNVVDDGQEMRTLCGEKLAGFGSAHSPLCVNLTP